MYKQVILASQSPRRRELLAQLDLDYVICPAEGEEQSEATLPQEYVKDLATCKAEEIAGCLMVDGQKWMDKVAGSDWSVSNPTLIIGADTVVARGDEILGKPVDEADAVRMLRMLQGATHQVYTGVSLLVVKEGHIVNQKSFYEKTDVTFGPM